MRESAVVLLSGGLDSSVLLYQMKAKGFTPIALTVKYGQRHAEEVWAAHAIAKEASVRHVVCDADAALAPVFASARSSQVGTYEAVPEGHYEHPAMAMTIVPNRNMVLLSIAGALAASRGATLVAYAVHAGDHAVYPDCRPEFITAMNGALILGTGVRLATPYMELTKSDIVKEGHWLNVPMEKTYSCYVGNRSHCGRCSTCVERQEAFSLAGVVDETFYIDGNFWQTASKEGA